ncbi:MAG TPA: oxalate/formate MFS antiporter [Acetobacteraceae bacterium]|nr:oxalate/formate MFS antiporter [Acetobacteraceae bacterium]
MSATPMAPLPPTEMPSGRWAQLWLGVLCMMLIANLQYAWTLFVGPIRAAHGWSLADIQWAFTIFIATETWITPFAGYAVDYMGPRRGPRLMILLGGIAVGLGWVMNAYADSLMLLYAGAAISGLGAGGIYATCVGNAVKWFPDRRGLAVGLTAAGFGAGAALTVIPIRMLIEAQGYGAAFLWFGAGQGIILIIVSGILRAPDQILAAPAAVVQRLNQSRRSFTSGEMLRSPIFWLMYVMFVLNAATGLMATAQLAPIAKDFGIANSPILFGATVLSVALVVDNILNGLARPFFGWVSDFLGRELTMGIAFFLGACSYGLLTVAGHGAWTFVICAGLIFFTWGEIFSLFPSLCTDTFGPKFAASNAALLYTAKGTAALLVPFANVLQSATGGWGAVFTIAAVSNVVVALLAVAALRPLRRRIMTVPQPGLSAAMR